MSSLDFIQSRNLMMKGQLGHITTDSPVAIRMRYIGTGTVTSVTVTQTTDLVNITSDGGTDTYTFATYTTLGALVDAINADGVFEAKILDGLRADASDDWLVAGAVSSSTVFEGNVSMTVYDLKTDTSVAKAFEYRLTSSRAFDAPKGTHRVHIQEIKYLINVGAAAANKVQIWEISGKNETQIYSATSVDNSATTISWASGYGKITSAEGDDLVVKIFDGTSIADDTGNYMTVAGLIE